MTSVVQRMPSPPATGRAGTARLRVAVTAGALRVPPSYFAIGQVRHLADADVDVAFFAGTADVREPLPGTLHTAPGGRLGPVRVRRLLGGLAWPALGRSIRAYGPDVVHQHFATWSRLAVDASRALGVPLVVSLHGYDVPAVAVGASPLVRWAARGVLERPAAYLAPSRHLAGRATTLGFPEERVRVHYQGVDTAVFAPPGAAVRRAAVTGGRLLFVGRLAPEKGVGDLLLALASLPERERPPLDVVGSGPDERDLRARASQLRLDVAFHGMQPRTEVLSSLHGAAALVLPAREHGGRQEAAGLVLLEAQACGVPVVAYASGGTPEMLVDGRTGHLVAEGDVPALAAAIAALVGADPDHALRTGEEAARFVRAERSERGWAARLEALYAELMTR